MKKRIWILMLFVLALSLAFSLAACDVLGGLLGGGGGTAPTFEKMTIYSQYGSASETFAYTKQYENVRISIKLDNPDDLVIVSVTINGTKYEASSFVEGSANRALITLNVYVYDDEGVITYTLESIDYIDGKAMKTITPTENNVVYAGVYIDDQVAAFVTGDVGFTDITLNVTVKDDNGLIAFSNGNVNISVHHGDTLIDSKTLVVGDNTVRFDGLEMGKWYWCDVLATYDDFKEGNYERLLANEVFQTDQVVAFDNVVETYDGVEFDLKWHEDVADRFVKELHLLDGDKDVKLFDASATKVTGQLSGKDYTVVVYFDYNGQTYNIRHSFHTLTKSAPNFFCSNLWVTEEEIRFDVMIDDPDHAGTLVTTLNGQEVSAPIVGIYTKQIKFSNLTYGQTYEIEISYDYDLNDGEGTHPLGESYTVTVDSQTIHQTSCKLRYTALDYNTCTVYKNSTCTHAVLAIPSTIDGYTVTKADRFTSNYLTTLILPDTITEFASSAFANCKNLTSVTFAQNLSVLGEKMFSGCESLSDVTIPTAVTEIPNEAFYGCKALTSITIPSNIVTVGNKAFRGTGLQTLTFAEGSKLKTVGDEAFYELNQITELTLPNGVVTIGSSAFYGLNQLTELTIPANVERIYGNAFSYCRALQNLTFEAGSKLRSIGDSAFYGCEKITELLLPSELYSIGDRAFVGLGITSITIPRSVDSIGNSAFTSSLIGGGLQEVIFEANSSLRIIGGGAFSNTALAKVTIPSSVSTIGAKAFYRCNSLTKVEFENGTRLQTIGDSAFAESSKFSSIRIPASVTTIGDSAFENTATFVAFDSGSKLYKIGNRAFYGCSGISNITIPASVESIGSYAFNSCVYLRTLTFEANSKLQTIGSYAFGECQFLTTVTVPSSVVTIGERAFQNSGLSTINYAEEGNLKTIGAYAFEGCNLTEIFVPNTVVTIGEGAYKGFGNINAITFEEGSQLQTIGAYAFEDCASLTEVVIPATVVTIGDGAFKNCSGLSTFIFEQGSQLQAVGAYFFEGCNLITEVVIPASVTSIGEGAFQNLVNLRSVTFEEGSQLQSIGYKAFEGCSSLPNLTLPEGLTNIASSAFYDCSALQWIVMPTSVKSIGNMAIERNSATVYYKGNYTEWCKVTMSSSDKNYFQEMYRNVYFFDGTQGYPSWYYDREGNPTPNNTRT